MSAFLKHLFCIFTVMEKCDLKSTILEGLEQKAVKLADVSKFRKYPEWIFNLFYSDKCIYSDTEYILKYHYILEVD